MFSLLIRDFSVNTEHLYSRPVPYRLAEIEAFCDVMMRVFGEIVKPENITLDSGDQLYDYELIMDMVGGSVEIVLTSKGVTSHFRGGQNQSNLNWIKAVIIGLDTVLEKSPTGFRTLTFSTHAEFPSPSEYDKHMEQFIGDGSKYSSGGKTLFCEGLTFKGTMRFSTEKSFQLKQALFVTAHSVIEEKFSDDILGNMHKRFLQVATDLKLDFQLKP